MTDTHTYWRSALEMGQGRELTRDQQKALGISDGHPQAGYYRVKGPDGQFSAVAIFDTGEELGGLAALRDGSAVDPIDIWTFASRWPISYELYQEVAEQGLPWPDAAVVAAVAEDDPADPFLAAKARWGREMLAIEKFIAAPIETQAEADRAGVWAKDLTALFNTIDAMFVAEKEPILLAGRAVGDKYRWREEIERDVKRIKAHVTVYLKKVAAAEAKRQREADEAAQAKQREADEAARLASLQNSPEARAEAQAKADELQADATAAVQQATPQPVYAGRTGAKLSMRTYYTGRIVDYEKLLMALKESPSVRAEVQRVIDRIAASKDAPMPAGSERVEDKRAV